MKSKRAYQMMVDASWSVSIDGDTGDDIDEYDALTLEHAVKGAEFAEEEMIENAFTAFTELCEMYDGGGRCIEGGKCENCDRVKKFKQKISKNDMEKPKFKGTPGPWRIKKSLMKIMSHQLFMKSVELTTRILIFLVPHCGEKQKQKRQMPALSRRLQSCWRRYRKRPTSSRTLQISILAMINIDISRFSMPKI